MYLMAGNDSFCSRIVFYIQVEMYALLLFFFKEIIAIAGLCTANVDLFPGYIRIENFLLL